MQPVFQLIQQAQSYLHQEFFREPDGQTWEYSLTLYENNSSYPDVSVMPDGNIHVIFDHARFKETPTIIEDNMEKWAIIYHTVLTEQYIKDHNGEVYDISKLHVLSAVTKELPTTLTGVVVAPDGTAVSGATLTYGTSTYTSADDGSFTFEGEVGKEMTITVKAEGYYDRSYVVSTTSSSVGNIVVVPNDAAYFGSVGGNSSTATFDVYGIRYDNDIRFVGISNRILTSSDHLELYSNVYSFTAKRTQYTAYTTFKGDGTIAMKYFPSGSAAAHPDTSGVSSTVYSDTILGVVPYTAWQAVCPSTYTVDKNTPIGLTFLSLYGSTSDTWTAESLGIELDATPSKKDSRTFVIWDAENNFYALSVASEKFGLIT